LDKRKEYIQKIQDENINIFSNIIYIDECGFNLHITRSQGRALSGKPAIRKVVNNRGKNITTIAAISENGIVKYSINLKSTNANIFAKFMRELISTIPSDHKKFFVMDNVKFHHSQVVLNTIKNTPHEILYLPPYSPFLNPIEYAFSKIKKSIGKNNLRNQEIILEKIKDTFNIVTEEDCNSWIRHTLSYFNLCLNKQEITV
jgi:transposase